MSDDLRIPTAVRGCYNIVAISYAVNSRLLSNFARTPFRLMESGRSVFLASMEGFIQGIKYAPHDPARTRAFQSAGLSAKAFSAEASAAHIYWENKILPRRSKEHFALIEQALRAKFAENPECVRALLSTHPLILTHETGDEEPPTTSLPARVFCEMLTRIRDDFMRYTPKIPEAS